MGESESTSPPPLDASARAVYRAARTLAGAWGGQLGALRALLAADFALARAALVQGAALLLAAAIAFACGWALLTALLVWALHHAGLAWGWALGLPMGVSLALGGWALWLGVRALKLANLEASRQQLSQWLEKRNTSGAEPGATADANPDRMQR